jgi:hypothetical protein
MTIAGIGIAFEILSENQRAAMVNPIQQTALAADKASGGHASRS